MSGDAELKYGYLVCQQTLEEERRATLIDEIVTEAKTAERCGFRGVFVSEHHQTRDNFFPSPVVLASALARETTTVDIGITVAVLPLYHPVRLVEDVTCVDIVANGRLIFGVGPGYVGRDFDLYGFTQPEAMGRYLEALEIIVHGWDRDWEHDGRYYRAKIEEIRPRPVSEPRPPIWIAGGTEAGVRRAATYGDGWVIGARSTLSASTRLTEIYRSECLRLGKTPEIAVIRDAWVSDTPERAFDEVGSGLLAAYNARVSAGFIRDPLLDGLGLGDLTDADVEAFYAIAGQWWVIGDGATARAQVDRWLEDVGISYLIVRFRHPAGPAHPVVVNQIERFSREVFGASQSLVGLPGRRSRHDL